MQSVRQHSSTLAVAMAGLPDAAIKNSGPRRNMLETGAMKTASNHKYNQNQKFTFIIALKEISVCIDEENQECFSLLKRRFILLHQTHAL